ncbi:MAG: T9SS type A sorting domain-containing protein [bacterium]
MIASRRASLRRRVARTTASSVLPALLLAWTVLAAPSARAGTIERRLDGLFADGDLASVPSGVLLDRVLPLVSLEGFDGSAGAAVASPAALRQIVDEIRRASLRPVAGPTADELRALGRDPAGAIPIAVVDARAQRIRPGSLEAGTARVVNGRIALGAGALEDVRVFAASSLAAQTRRGATVSFVLRRELWMATGRLAPSRVEIDLADGRGFRAVSFDEPIRPSWSAPGRREVVLRATWADGDLRIARFRFDVVRLVTPAPDDTLLVTGSAPYGGVTGTGKAYVYLASGHAAIENPIVVIEGFDLDDSMHWDELYALLNQQNMLEDLRADGFDAVVLDFDSATDPVQRNAYVVAALLQEVAATISPQQSVFLVGASMGGLCARYALLWLESQSIDPRVRTYLSFDAPHNGANIPLGMQYWLDFFSGQSTEAQYLLSRLDTPAARQLLAYHHTTPPGSTGEADPLRGTMLSDFAGLGGWPAGPRLVAVSNGSGSAANQGFAAGAQIILYHYTSFVVNIDGNVWAVPDGGSHTQIFQGRIKFLILPADTMNAFVTATSPWDNAPGGNRDSMAQMDTVSVPYGDIVALYPNHCFVPTISALALDTTNLFYDVAGDPNLMAHTPFAAVRWASTNEEHVFVDADTKAWVEAEVLAGPTGAPVLPLDVTRGVALSLRPAFPNPFRDSVTLRFALGRPSPVTLDTYDVAGRRVARLLDGKVLSAGDHSVRWAAPTSGVYFYRVRAGGEGASGRVAAVE